MRRRHVEEALRDQILLWETVSAVLLFLVCVLALEAMP